MAVMAEITVSVSRWRFVVAIIASRPVGWLWDIGAINDDQLDDAVDALAKWVARGMRVNVV